MELGGLRTRGTPLTPPARTPFLEEAGTAGLGHDEHPRYLRTGDE